jgi:hypothetical protein
MIAHRGKFVAYFRVSTPKLWPRGSTPGATTAILFETLPPEG